LELHLITDHEELLREIPPAARYLDLYWSIATSHADWKDIRTRMSGAVHAVQQLDPAAASDYALLRDIAGQRMLEAMPASVYSMPEVA